MNIFKGRTRKASEQRSVVDSTPVEQKAQPRPRVIVTESPSRISRIESVEPQPGMTGILITDGFQLTIEYLREVPYNGPVPSGAAFVRPVPTFRIGNQLPLFVDGKHYIAIIKEVVAHASVRTEDAPRIDTDIFDFPTITAGSTFMDHNVPQPSTAATAQNGLALLTIPDVVRSSEYTAPSPDTAPLPISLQHEPAAYTTRGRANTLSIAAEHINQANDQVFQRVHADFKVADSLLMQHKAEANLSSQFPLQNGQNAPTATPNSNRASQHRRHASAMAWMGHPRTNSDVGEGPATSSFHSRDLHQPSTSNNVPAQSNASTIPRRRLHSDAALSQPRSSASVTRSSTVQGQGRPTSRWATRKPAPRLSHFSDASEVKPAPKARSLLNFAAAKAKIPFLHGGAPPSDFKDAGDPSTMATTTTMTTDALLQGALIGSAASADVAPSIPTPRIGDRSLGGTPEVPWISFTDVAWSSQSEARQASTQVRRTELLLDPLSPQEKILRERRPSHPPAEGSLEEIQRRQSKRAGYVPPAINPYDGRAVRPRPRTVNASPGPSAAPSTLSTRQSRADSRKESARKDLPPIPPVSPLLYSPESMLRPPIAEEKTAEKECRRGKSIDKTLSDALELTPPPSPKAKIFNAFASTPLDSPPAPHRTAHPSSTSTDSHPPSITSSHISSIVPNAMLTTIQVAHVSKNKGKERMIYDAKPHPAPLAQIHTRRPYSSLPSIASQTTHDGASMSSPVAAPSLTPLPEPLPYESTSTVTSGGTRLRYETPLSPVTEVSMEDVQSPHRRQALGLSLNGVQLPQTSMLGSANTRVISSGSVRVLSGERPSPIPKI